jgi:hypothetical protein
MEPAWLEQVISNIANKRLIILIELVGNENCVWILTVEQFSFLIWKLTAFKHLTTFMSKLVAHHLVRDSESKRA